MFCFIGRWCQLSWSGFLTVLIDWRTNWVRVRVRVRVTLRLSVYRQSLRLGDKPLETHDQ
jgi:hypothetical protein